MRLRLRFLILSSLSLFAATSAAQDSASRHVWSDFDGDGLPDLYVAAPGRDDVLLRNAGDGSFADATQAAGLAGLRSAAVRPGDFDRDELADLLLLSEDGELRLFRGVDGGAFLEAAEAGVALQGAADAEWVDYDHDGWVDLKAETEAGEPVLFHNVEGLFERIELGLETRVASLVGGGVVTPLAPPAEQADQAPSLGGRVPVSGTGTGTGKQGLRMPPDVSIAIGGGVETSLIDLVCSEAVRDASNRSNCIQASSNPTMGMLYPLSSNRYIDPATGFVGLGTTNPTARLDVAGAARVRGLTVLGGSLDVENFRMRLVNTSTGTGTVLADPTGPNSGGMVVLRTDDNNNTVELRGDAGSDEGQIILRDANSGSPVDGVALRARHVFGSGEGGVVTVLNGEGQVTGRLVGDDGNDEGRLILLEGDGSTAYSASGDLLSGFDSGGTQTFSLDRQTGDVSQPLGAGGFVKAAVFVDNDSSGTLLRSFSSIPGSSITSTRISAGVYSIDFGVSIEDRYFHISPLGSNALEEARIAGITGNTVVVNTYELGVFSTPVSANLVSNLQDGYFMLLVY